MVEGGWKNFSKKKGKTWFIESVRKNFWNINKNDKENLKGLTIKNLLT